MAENLSKQEKWVQMRDLSNEQSERLAKVILNGDQKEAPDIYVDRLSFYQFLRNNEVSIADRFTEYDASGKYTEGLPEDQFSLADINIYKNLLVTKTAMQIVGTYFYTD
jgi:hypothetical protein